MHDQGEESATTALKLAWNGVMLFCTELAGYSASRQGTVIRDQGQGHRAGSEGSSPRLPPVDKASGESSLPQEVLQFLIMTSCQMIFDG